MKLYKFLHREHATDFVNQGKVLFGSLAKYINIENAEIADRYEGRRVYKTKNKLRAAQGNSIIADDNFTFESYLQSEEIFSFCTSYSSKIIFDAYDTCIEITDHEEFAKRIKNSFKRRKISFHHGKVNYYNQNDPPLGDWALPEKICFSKLENFKNEAEYRYIFSHTNALEFGSTKQILTTAKPEPSNKNFPQRLLRLGNLNDICHVYSV